MCERYQISDRAVIANSAMVDIGINTDEDKTCVLDRSKLLILNAFN